MRNIYIFYFFASLFIVLFASSCLVEPKFPVEPKITNGKIALDTISNPDMDSLILSFDFQDGDGDLGIEATENDSTINLYQDLFIKNADGQFEKYIDPFGQNPFYDRLPLINKDGKPKPIEGNIRRAKDLSPGFKGVISGKTIMFKIKVVDRAGHESNNGEWLNTDTLALPKI